MQSLSLSKERMVFDKQVLDAIQLVLAIVEHGNLGTLDVNLEKVHRFCKQIAKPQRSNLDRRAPLSLRRDRCEASGIGSLGCKLQFFFIACPHGNVSQVDVGNFPG